MDKTTSRLVDFVLGTGMLPDRTVHECKRRIIDTLACAFGGYHHPVSVLARGFAVRNEVSSGPAIWGSETSCTEEDAAFANGVMLRVLDLSDTYLGKSRGHPSDVMAGIMAVADAERSSGLAVIDAIAVAYDIYCSFCDAIDINSEGWDQPIYSILATTAGIARLLGLTREQLADAIGLALAPNMALYQTRMGQLSVWKGCASANASRNAIFAARLAQSGITGPREVFEGKSGLWNAVGRFDWVFPSDREHKIDRTHVKCFPICYHGQSSAWAALEARRGVAVDAITRIRVATYRQAVAMMGSDPSRWAPSTRETADHSLPFVVATGLLHGAISLNSFSEQRLKDPKIAALMAKVIVEEDGAFSSGYPETAGSRLTIETDSGSPFVTEVKYPKGHANLPMEDGQINVKFIELFQEYGKKDHAERLLPMLWSLDRLENFCELVYALKPSSQ